MSNKVLYYVVRTWPTTRFRNEIGDQIVHGWLVPNPLVPNTFTSLNDAVDEAKRFVSNYAYQCCCPPSTRNTENAVRSSCPLADHCVEVFQVEAGKTRRMVVVSFHAY